MQFRFKLNNIIIDEPTGTGELTDTLGRDRNLKGLFVRRMSRFAFRGQGINYYLQYGTMITLRTLIVLSRSLMMEIRGVLIIPERFSFQRLNGIILSSKIVNR